MLDRDWLADGEVWKPRKAVFWTIAVLLVISISAYWVFFAPKGQATIEVVVEPTRQDSIVSINLVRGRLVPLTLVSKENRPIGMAASWDPSFTFVGLKPGWYRYFVMELEFDVSSYLCANAITYYVADGRLDEVTDPKHCIISATYGKVFVEEGLNPPLEVDLNLPPGAPDGRE